MSIAATDLPNAGAGVSGTAIPEMPPLELDAMPEGAEDDAPVEAGLGADVAIPSDPAEAGLEDADVRARIETEVRESVLAEVRQQFNEQFNTLRATKDREIDHVRDLANQSLARERVRAEWLANYFQHNGLDPRDLAVLENELTAAERDSVRSQQAQVATVAQIDQEAISRFQYYQEEARKAGKPEINPNDPVFLERWNGFVQMRRSLGPAALRAARNMQAGEPVSPGDARALMDVTMHGNVFRDWQENYRESLVAKQQTEKDRAAAAQQAQARTRQQNRGAQHTHSGSGAGPMSDDAAWEAAKREFPDDHEARFKRYRQLQHPQAR